MPAQESQPQPPPEPAAASPARRRPPARRSGSRIHSPGSETITRRLVAASGRRPRGEGRSGDRLTGDSPRTPQPPGHAVAVITAEPVEEASETAEETRETAEDPEADETDEAAEGAENVRTVKAGRRTTPTKGTDAAKKPARRRQPRPLLLPVVLGIVTVLLGGLAAWFGAEAHGLTSTPAAGNTALTDTAATSEVRSQVKSAVNALFSYNYANPGPTTRAAGRLLTGPAVRQYASLFAQVRKNAPGQKLVVTTAVTSLGVEFLTGGQARLLLFATETDTRAGGGQPASAAAMLAVNAVRQDGTWKIESISTY